MDVTLKQQQVKRLGAHELQVIHVDEAAQFRGEVEIRAHVDEKNSGIDEIGLTFVFAGAQVRQKAVRRRQQDASAGEANAFAIPEAENSPGEFGHVVNRVEAVRAAGGGIAIA